MLGEDSMHLHINRRRALDCLADTHIGAVDEGLEVTFEVSSSDI